MQVLMMWYLKLADVPWWSYVLLSLLACPAMAFQEACVAVVLAPSSSPTRSSRSPTGSLRSRATHTTPTVLEAGRALFDYDTVSRELHDLYNGLIPRCESSTTGIITVYGALMFVGGATWTYAGATGAFGRYAVPL